MYIKTFESYNSSIFYHGSNTLFPFETFDPFMDGTGIVSSGSKKYKGFFFTSEQENAEYYTEWFVIKCNINNIKPSPINHPSSAMLRGVDDREIYQINSTLDGSVISDIVVVPYSELKNVNILTWEFIGHRESYFDSLDQMFYSGDEEDYIDDDGQHMPYVSKYMIEDFCNTIGDLEYMLDVPIFNEYYNSKPE